MASHRSTASYAHSGMRSGTGFQRSASKCQRISNIIYDVIFMHTNNQPPQNIPQFEAHFDKTNPPGDILESDKSRIARQRC